jgi:hypothetical protein
MIAAAWFQRVKVPSLAVFFLTLGLSGCGGPDGGDSSSSSSSSGSSSSGVVCTTNCSGVVINEAVSSNAEFEDEDGDSEDWFELYNHSNESVSLAGWTVSDDPMKPKMWQFPDVTLAPGAYLVVWASDKDRAVSGRPLHTNFKISSSGETLYLYDDQGVQRHSLEVSGLRTGTSVGLSRTSRTLVYYDQPTPGAVNSGQEYRGVVQNTVQFSQDGGVTNNTMVMLTGAENNQVIRYTTDGKVPSLSSPLYQGALLIPENTAIRARVFADGFIPSVTQSRTFLVNARHDIPVVTLEADPLDFFDTNYGIYVLGPSYQRDPPNYGANFWQDWERDIHFGFYETNGRLGIEFNTGVQIFGGYTRSFAQKALAFYARGRYGVDKFEYPFFPELKYKKFERLVLRASGNDWMRTMFRDRAFTSLMEGSGLDYQAGRAVAVYLNGDYWGLHNLRERVNEEFLSAKHGVKKGDVTLLEANAEVLAGSNEEYLAMVDYISNHDPAAPDFYDTAAAQMDMENFIAYQVVQIFIANEDWPIRNIKFWKTPSTKWRWILYDTDFGFGLYERNVSKNSLEYATSARVMGGGSNPPWSTLLLRRLLENPKFKAQFISYFADQLNSRFLPANIEALVERLADEIRTEIPLQKERWGGRNWDWDGEVRSLITYANSRPGYVWQHLQRFFALSAPETLTIEFLDTTAGSVKVNSVVVNQEHWTGNYFAEVPVTVSAIAKPGFRFSHWDGSDITDATLTLTLTEAVNLTPVFVAN